MSDPTETGEPASQGRIPGYQVDDQHDSLRLELVDPTGVVVFSIPIAAPLNRNAAAPYAVQARVTHADGCSRILQRDPLTTY